VPPDLSSIDTAQVFHGFAPLGIVIALVGGVFLALGAQFQHRGVEVVEEKHGSGHKAGSVSRSSGAWSGARGGRSAACCSAWRSCAS
jgi:hypothetical protein